MLQTIRDRISGWVAYFIVGLIAIPFALWGIHQYLGGGEQLLAASVGETEITLQDYYRDFQQRKREIESATKKKNVDEEIIKHITITGLIRNELIKQYSDEEQYTVSDQTLLKFIQSDPIFMRDGVFDKQHYHDLLSSRRIEPSRFEDQYRESIRLEQFTAAVADSTVVTESRLDNFESLAYQSRKFKYFTLTPSLFMSDQNLLSIPDTILKKYYAEHPEMFQTDEQVQIEYIDVNEKDVAIDDDINEQKVVAFYENNLADYQTPEERRLSHIVLKSHSEDEKLLSEAERIVDRIKNGESFGALAKEFSDDNLSVKSSGDIGWFIFGELEDEINSAAFNLSEQEVSQPIETSRGVVILKVTDIKLGSQYKYEDVRSRVIENYKRNMLSDRFTEVTEHLANLSYEHPTELDTSADALGLNIKKTGWLPLKLQKSEDSILAYQEIMDLLTQEDILIGGMNSELIELEPGRVVVIRVADYKKNSIEPFNKAAEQIRELIHIEDSVSVLREAGKDVLDALEKGETIDAMSRKYNVDLIETVVTRDEPTIPREIITELFALARPLSQPVYSVVNQLDGSLVVVELLEVQPGTTELSNTAQYTTMKNTLIERELDAVIGALAEDQEIQIFHENLKSR